MTPLYTPVHLTNRVNEEHPIYAKLFPNIPKQLGVSDELKLLSSTKDEENAYAYK